MATYVYTAILSKAPLTWFGLAARIPTAVLAETGGGGDDLQIEFGPASASEVQVRHQMNAAGRFTDLVAAIASRTKGKSQTSIALIAGRHQSSAKLFSEIARDLDGLRANVEDDRFATPVRHMVADPETRRVLENLFVVDADFDRLPSPDRENALEKLRRRLADPSKAEEAWAVLFADAVDLCANGSRRTDADLVNVLAAHGFALRSSTADEELYVQLESIRTRILEQHYPDLAFDELQRVISEIDSRQAGATTRAEAMRLLAHALLALQRVAEARIAARRAVELDPGTADTHATYARILAEDGDITLARDEVGRALAIDPANRRGWVANLHVALKSGDDPGDPPDRLLDDPLFRADLAAVRAEQEQWQSVRDLTEPLLAESAPRPHVRYLHATALFLLGSKDIPDDAMQRRAEEELTALIDSLRHDHPLLVPALYNRAGVRRRLGRAEEAASDEEELRKTNRDNPEIVQQIAAARMVQGDSQGALLVLETSVVPASPALLAMRAGLLAEVGRVPEAKRDLEASAEAMASAEEPDRVAYQLGEVAVDLGDLARARAFHNMMSEQSRDGVIGRLLSGVIAFAEGDVDGGVASYRGAIDVETEDEKRRLLRLRLAMSLRDAKRPKDGLAVLNEVGLENIANREIQLFVTTAFVADDLSAAKRAIDRLAEDGPLPRWALSVRADIGLRSADPESVLADVLAMEQQGEASVRVHLTLARCLIELGRMPEALGRVQAAIAGLATPRERLEAGVYLKRLHRNEDALAQLFRAYREDRNDPQIQRSLATMVMTGGDKLQLPETAVPGSHVQLRRADGAKRNHTIFAEPPLEKALGELLVDEAGELLGHIVGDAIIRDRRPLPDEIWTIEEIIPAEVHAARSIIATFQDAFPNEPFFVMAVHVGELDKVGDFAELLTMLGSRRDHVIKVLEFYHENGFPIEFVARMLGTSISELMDVARNPGGAPLIVEFADVSNYVEAARAAGVAKTLVLTRSALFIARREHLLDLLASNYELVAPTSLEWHLREEVEVATEAVRSGHSVISTGPAGIAMIDLEPNDPTLVATRDEAAETLAWLLDNATRLPRPLEAIADAVGAEAEFNLDRLRDELGPASFDASVLASHGFGLLYADDLGLRRFAVRDGKPPAGVSTATLVEALVNRGVLSASDRGRIHADLVLAGCVFVPPSDDLLKEAVQRMPALGAEHFKIIFDTLGGPLCDPRTAAEIIGRTLQFVARQAIPRASLEEVAEAAILGLAKSMPRSVAAAVVRLVSNKEFRLLPIHLARVDSVCDRFAINEPPIIS